MLFVTLIACDRTIEVTVENQTGVELDEAWFDAFCGDVDQLLLEPLAHTEISTTESKVSIGWGDTHYITALSTDGSAFCTSIDAANGPYDFVLNAGDGPAPGSTNNEDCVCLEQEG